jgi:iron complex outermembrane receptor protein/hemoglobin/transferrin/lactoferrin receptor protein
MGAPMKMAIAPLVRRVVTVSLWLSVASAAGPQPHAQEETSHDLAGTVRDETGALPGAQVRLVELGSATRTDERGSFRFTGIPAGRLTIAVELPGFVPLRRVVAVPTGSDLVLQLEPDLRFADEVSVSAAPWALRPLETPQQTDQVDAAEVRRDRVASVGEALSKAPGVAFIPTGNALGTPVVRGVSSNRVRVLNDGIALNHQQFSWRHSPNVEPGFAERVELVRGPSSVLYGPDAMGGVINLIHGPLPHAVSGRRVFHGELSPGISTNADEWAGQGRLEGAFGGIGWRADVVHREAGDITTPRGALENTDFDQTNAAVMTGYSGTWGSARARWHHWQTDTGFYRPVAFRLGLQDDLVAGDLHVATRAGVVELLAGHQRNSRRAFEVPGRPATLDLDQRTLTARAGLQHPDIGDVRGHVAVEYQGVENQTLVGTLVPDYRTDTAAGMVFEEFRLLPTGTGTHRMILSGGLRGDVQSLEATRADLEAAHDYRALTGALGCVVRLHADLALAGSLSRGWRPPTPFELYAFGVHGGVAAFQLGNPDLGEESNVNGEVSLRYQGPTIQASLAAYRTVFDNYIYLADSGATVGPLPVFVYRQAGATMKGIEATFDAVPRPWLKLGLALTVLGTRNDETRRLLPQTPADRLLASVEVRRPRMGALRDAFAGLDASFVGAGEVSGPDEPLGTPTDAYEVFDLRAGSTLPLGRTQFGLALVVRNLFDREYTDFLWSYKPYAPNPGRDVRLTATWRF